MQELHEQLVALTFIIALLLVTPVVFIALDYWAGIRKARKRGDQILSDKLKRTVDKISRYYNAVLAMLVVDCIQMAGFIFLYLFYEVTPYTIPVFTVGAVFFVAFVEIKSIYEPADVKESREMKEVAALAKKIIANKSNPEKLAQSIIDYLNNNKS
jgi:hypothetical protein